MLKIQERSPQYLTLMEKSAELHTIIACNPLIVARKFQAHGLVDINTVDNTTKGVDSGRDLALVVNQLMKNVRVKIQFEPNAFYSLVDALEECADQLPVGKVGLLLKEHCGKPACTLIISENTYIHVHRLERLYFSSYNCLQCILGYLMDCPNPH